MSMLAFLPFLQKSGCRTKASSGFVSLGSQALGKVLFGKATATVVVLAP